MESAAELRKRAAHARRLATENTPGGRPKGGFLHLLGLADKFDHQADLLERTRQKPKAAPAA